MENINTVLTNLPTTISAYVVENSDMSYTIVLNSRLSYEKNLDSYQHEILHIINKDHEGYNVNEIELFSHGTKNNHPAAK